MRQVWLTAKYEIRTTLARKGFWLTTFLLPAIVLVMVFLPQILTGTGSGDAEALIPTEASQVQAVGCVDPIGLLHTRPPDVPAELVRVYTSEAEAQEALARAEISCYYLLSPDYLATGGLTVVQARYQPLRALDSTDLVTYVINTSLTGDATLAHLLLDPTPAVQTRSLAPVASEAAVDPSTAYLLPYLLMFVLYMALAMTGGYMLQSVSREKENRTAEVLLVSTRPKDLMMGKIVGLSAVGLLQVLVWLAVIFGVFLSRQSLFGVDFTLGGEVAGRAIPWTLIYFLLGYLMYAAIYGLLGVLSPTARDANQFVFIAIIPLMVPLFLLSALIESPEGLFAVVLSLFPPTAPVAMAARLGTVAVPVWQLLIGAVLLAVFAYLLVLLAGRLFRADNLLSTRALTWGRLRAELCPSTRLTLPRNEATTAGSGKPETPKAFQAASPPRSRSSLLTLVGLVILVVGAVGYAQGNNNGLYLAILGLVISALAYRQHRRH